MGGFVIGKLDEEGTLLSDGFVGLAGGFGGAGEQTPDFGLVLLGQGEAAESSRIGPLPNFAVEHGGAQRSERIGGR